MSRTLSRRLFGTVSSERKGPMRIFFDDFVIDTEAWELRRGGALVDIQSKPLELLMLRGRGGPDTRSRRHRSD